MTFSDRLVRVIMEPPVGPQGLKIGDPVRLGLVMALVEVADSGHQSPDELTTRTVIGITVVKLCQCLDNLTMLKSGSVEREECHIALGDIKLSVVDKGVTDVTGY